MDRVGESAAADVYQASSREHGVVALKIWKSPALQGQAEFERFRKDAEINARLVHPHIARFISAP